MRRFLIIACALGLLLGVTSGASARTKTPGAALRCVEADGSTVVQQCFTQGDSADGDRKAITVDGTGAHPISSIAFDNWWCQTLESVQQLKISTQEPVTPGSPRISIYLSDDVTGPTGTAGCNSSTWNGHTLFLSPYYCNSSNGNGWRTSNWRGDSSCTLFYDTEPTGYAGWDAFTAAHPNTYIWFAFVVQDEPQASRVDRIQLDSTLFTK